jgi:5-(carboxyamino)imidazole ribonucleotide mutase
VSRPPVVAVAVLMGSRSDQEVMLPAFQVLRTLEIRCHGWVISAHRSLDAMIELVRSADEAGVRVVIAGAGGAAHLPGVAASVTRLPVIGVPLPSPLLGLDSIMSIVQMPRGVPVATMAIGATGAANAAVYAARILALSDPALAGRLKAFTDDLGSGLPLDLGSGGGGEAVEG